MYITAINTEKASTSTQTQGKDKPLVKKKPVKYLHSKSLPTTSSSNIPDSSTIATNVSTVCTL